MLKEGELSGKRDDGREDIELQRVRSVSLDAEEDQLGKRAKKLSHQNIS